MVVEIARVGALASIELAEPLHFSVAEMVALVGACGLSLGMFLWRMRPIAGNILRAKKDVGFSLTHVGRRVWEFFSEVLCQSKVIRQRPLPGLAHAFVFWGFLAFALVTTNHVLTGLRMGVVAAYGDRGGVLLRLRGVVGAAGGGVDCGAVCAAVFCAAAMAGRKDLD